jgi:2-polyprenyl-3-methyl-5-hydroxy-6-metoxy-1,4-benzoquinol methylase
VSNNALGALTQESYWSDVWSATEDEARPVDGQNARYLEQEYQRFFLGALAGRRAGSLLEVGCGSSKWMPFFASRFGYQVTGIDYSAIGCLQASKLLQQAGVAGEVFQRDALAENRDLCGRFDVVASLGLVEHFAVTSEITRSLARYVKPGGLLISSSPNLAGILGRAQRFLNRPVYDVHVPFTLVQLIEAHYLAGLQVESSAYLGGLDFHELNLHGAPGLAKSLASRALMRLSRLGWRAPFAAPRGRRWSSGMVVVAIKPNGSPRTLPGDVRKACA